MPEIVDADGHNDQNKVLKTITWPNMDDDGLPSAYITKVMVCISKWVVKMTGLIESIEGIEDPAANISQFLWCNLTLIYIQLCTVWMFAFFI